MPQKINMFFSKPNTLPNTRISMMRQPIATGMNISLNSLKTIQFPRGGGSCG
jgi:hypothetical protein